MPEESARLKCSKSNPSANVCIDNGERQLNKRRHYTARMCTIMKVKVNLTEICTAQSACYFWSSTWGWRGGGRGVVCPFQMKIKKIICNFTHREGKTKQNFFLNLLIRTNSKPSANFNMKYTTFTSRIKALRLTVMWQIQLIQNKQTHTEWLDICYDTGEIRQWRN